MLRDMQGRVWCQDATTAHILTASWAIGRAPLTLAIECVIAGEHVTAFIDTGAPWSVIGGALVSHFSDALEPLGAREVLQTAHGRLEGELHLLNITLSGEGPSGLDLKVKVIASDAWTGPPLILGMRGCLDSFRWALDAGTRADDTPRLFFGAPP